MATRDPEKTRRLRTAVRYLVEHGSLERGNQAVLGRHFQVSRQMVSQIVGQEKVRRELQILLKRGEITRHSLEYWQRFFRKRFPKVAHLNHLVKVEIGSITFSERSTRTTLKAS